MLRTSYLIPRERQQSINIFLQSQNLGKIPWSHISCLIPWNWWSPFFFRWYINAGKIKLNIQKGEPNKGLQLEDRRIKYVEGKIWVDHFAKFLSNCAYVVISRQLHPIKPQLRFCADLNHARVVPDIRNGEDLWQWSRLEIRLITIRWSTIPKNQFIIIIIIIIIIMSSRRQPHKNINELTSGMGPILSWVCHNNEKLESWANECSIFDKL